MKDKNVLITGSQGFLGKHLAKTLEEKYQANVMIMVHDDDPSLGVNLLDHNHAETCIENCTRYGRNLDYVFHLAGFNGGIEFNKKFPADIFYANTIMGLNLLDACAGNKNVGKIVSVVASCGYPDNESGILEEELFLEGHPHFSVACHGYAKRNLQLASRFYQDQYGLNAVCVCPTTVYGPGDSFDPVRTKIMAGMVKRFVDARREGKHSVKVWGNGLPLREFIYVDDAVKLIVEAAKVYDWSRSPLNIGTGQEISVKELAELVAKIVGYDGEIEFDFSMPTGQGRKRLCLDRMKNYLFDYDFDSLTTLESGISKTVKWYEDNHAK